MLVLSAGKRTNVVASKRHNGVPDVLYWLSQRLA
jgi:hypothetical protein